MRTKISAFILTLGVAAAIWLFAPLTASAGVGDVFEVGGLPSSSFNETGWTYSLTYKVLTENGRRGYCPSGSRRS